MEFKKFNNKNVFIFLALGLAALFLFQFLNARGGKGKTSKGVSVKSHVGDFKPPQGGSAEWRLPGFTAQSSKWETVPQSALEVPELVKLQSPALKKYPKPVAVVEPVKTYTVAKKTLALQPAQSLTPSRVSQKFPEAVQPNAVAEKIAS